MSSVLPAPAVRAKAPGAVRPGWFAGFGMRHVAVVLVFSAVVPLTGVLFKLAVDHTLHAAPVAVEALACLLGSLCAMLSVVAVENRLAAVRPAARMAIAVLIASISGTALVEAATRVLRPLGMPLEDPAASLFVGDAHRIAFHFAGMATWSLVLIALYLMFEAKWRATAELHAARVAALAAERDLVEGNLRAMQARVDPKLLFDALLAVDQAYVGNVRSGEQALDALIGFLRAALPAEGAGTATLASELERVRAYFAVVELLSVAKLELEIAVEPEVQAVSIPAMLLLPLARWALEGAKALRLKAQRRGGVLVIALASDAAAQASPPGEDIAGVRQRLAHLYGERGRLELRSDAREVLIRIPL